MLKIPTIFAPDSAKYQWRINWNSISQAPNPYLPKVYDDWLIELSYELLPEQLKRVEYHFDEGYNKWNVPYEERKPAIAHIETAFLLLSSCVTEKSPKTKALLPVLPIEKFWRMQDWDANPSLGGSRYHYHWEDSKYYMNILKELPKIFTEFGNSMRNNDAAEFKETIEIYDVFLKDMIAFGGARMP